MDKVKIDELGRLHAAATPGEWRPGIPGNQRAYGPDGRGADSGLLLTFYGPKAHLNKAWVTAIHNAAPELFAYVRRLEAERDEAVRNLSTAKMADYADELLSARDARMKREGAAEWLEQQAKQRSLISSAMMIKAAQRLREGE